MEDPIRIAILIESSSSYGRGLIRGICSHCKSIDKVRLAFQESTIESELPEWFDPEQFQGVVPRISSEVMLDRILESGIPCVDTLGAHLHPNIITVDSDHDQIAQLAEAHFVEAQSPHRAFFGIEDAHFSSQRFGAFQQQTHHHVHQLQLKLDQLHFSRTRAVTPETRAQIQGWLIELPKPIAIFCANDSCGVALTRECVHLGLKVPEDIAILGVDDDEILCNLQSAPLSSIRPNSEHQGKIAAQVLLQKIDGQYDGPQTHLIPALGIEHRGTTIPRPSRSRHVTSALQLIQQELQSGLGSEQIAQEIGISRSLLDRKFKAELGHSVAMEIQATRLNAVLNLLKFSEKSLSAIARLTGLSDASSLSRFVKTHTSQTPGEIRTNFQKKQR